MGGDEDLSMSIDRASGKDVDSPKHGKIDSKNEPHIGGNQWAGGTGGRDTAGLGGKGGPYRLDAGHQVHQVPESEKADVPDHVKKAARQMNRLAGLNSILSTIWFKIKNFKAFHLRFLVDNMLVCLILKDVEKLLHIIKCLPETRHTTRILIIKIRLICLFRTCL